MLVLKVIASNLTIIQHLNGGVRLEPQLPMTYFVMEEDRSNIVVTKEELHKILDGRPIYTTVRKFSYV